MMVLIGTVAEIEDDEHKFQPVAKKKTSTAETNTEENPGKF